MATLVFALNQSLDGYVDHDRFERDPDLFEHFTQDVRSVAGAVYGRKMYEIMRYWDEEQPSWGEAERDYAAAWRAMRKWVVSSTLDAVGPNASLVSGDLEAAIRELKASVEGEIEVAGPVLAGSLTDLGLIDEYRLYVHPVVLGHGRPLFTGPRPRMRLIDSEQIGAAVIRLRYASA